MEEYTAKIIKGPYLVILSIVLFIQMSNSSIAGQIMSFFTIDPIVDECDAVYKDVSTGHCDIDAMCKAGINIVLNTTETLDNWSTMFKLYCPRDKEYVNYVRLAYFIASLVFPLCISKFPDYYGRMRILNILMILMLISFGLMLIKHKIAHLIGMILSGGLLMIYNLISQIITEFYDASIRGTVTGIFFSGIPICGIGYVFVFYIYKSLNYFWYILIATQLLSIILLNVFYVESPIWLLSNNEKEKCIKYLTRISKWNCKTKQLLEFQIKLNENDTTSIHNNNNNNTNENVKQNKKYSYIDVFRYKSIRNIIFKICPYWTAVLLFDFVVFLNLDNSGKDVYLHAIDIFAACTVSAFIAGLLADCLGRKALMIISALLSCVAYTLQPYFAMKANEDQLYHILNMAMLFTACISIETAFTVVVIYSAEVFPTSIKGTAGGVLFTLTRIGAIVSPYVVAELKYPQVVVSGCLIVTMFIICTVSETKGKKLKEEVDEVEKEREDKEREEGKDNNENIDLIPEEYHNNRDDGNLLVIN